MIFRKQKTELGEATRFRDRFIGAFKRSKPLSEQVDAKESRKQGNVRSVNDLVVVTVTDLNGNVLQGELRQKRLETLFKEQEEASSNMLDRKLVIKGILHVARVIEIEGAIMAGGLALLSQLGFKDFFDFTMGCAVGIFASGALMELGFRLGIRRALKDEKSSKVET